MQGEVDRLREGEVTKAALTVLVCQACPGLSLCSFHCHNGNSETGSPKSQGAGCRWLQLQEGSKLVRSGCYAGRVQASLLQASEGGDLVPSCPFPHPQEREIRLNPLEVSRTRKGQKGSS